MTPGIPESRRRIVIAGGGAAGVLVTVNLLRVLTTATDIVLVERTGDFGPGVPYRTTNPDHRLNVPAARMSAFAEEPGHFLDWLRRRYPDAADDTYSERGIYGDYLREILEQAERNTDDSSVRIVRVADEITGVSIFGDQAAVTLAKGQTLDADHIVIATGPVPSQDPLPIPEELVTNGVYVRNAWDHETIRPAGDDREVLIIGTGLTMVDATLSLIAKEPGPQIRAVSRNGLVPRSHLRGLTNRGSPDLPETGALSIEDLMACFSRELAQAQLAGDGWRDAVDSMRSVIPGAWRRIPVVQRRWFIENMNRVWDVHRFRMAPEVAVRFNQLLSSGRVRVSAGRIESIEPSARGARVTLLNESGAEVAEFDRVINSSGAGTDVRACAPPFLKQLLADRLIDADGLGLGLEVAPDGSAIRPDGSPSDMLSVLGSLRRGVEWESIGVTELRTQAATIAGRLASAVTAGNELPGQA